MVEFSLCQTEGKEDMNGSNIKCCLTLGAVSFSVKVKEKEDENGSNNKCWFVLGAVSLV